MKPYLIIKEVVKAIDYTVPQTIRFQNSLFCLLIVYILRCASASIGMYYISK